MVALTGYMGAGKTTVGRALANLLRWSFFDLDCEIELREKLLVHEIFQLRGESGFREVETDTLRSVLQPAPGPTVIALGGGTFVQSVNADLLRSRGARVIPHAATLVSCVHSCAGYATCKGNGNNSCKSRDESISALSRFRAYIALASPRALT